MYIITCMDVQTVTRAPRQIMCSLWMYNIFTPNSLCLKIGWFTSITIIPFIIHSNPTDLLELRLQSRAPFPAPSVRPDEMETNTLLSYYFFIFIFVYRILHGQTSISGLNTRGQKLATAWQYHPIRHESQPKLRNGNAVKLFIEISQNTMFE